MQPGRSGWVNANPWEQASPFGSKGDGLGTAKALSVKVGKKDDLASLARRHRVSVAQIKSWNNLQVDRLRVGQSLKLEVPHASAKRSGKTRQAVRQSRRAKVKVAASGKGGNGKTLIASDRAGKKPPG